MSIARKSPQRIGRCQRFEVAAIQAAAKDKILNRSELAPASRLFNT